MLTAALIIAAAVLLLIGTTLFAEGFQFHFSKNYVYFAMAFSGAVETANILLRGKKETTLKNK
jgi:predicted tellurium resistance membrane protein TerC